MKETSNMDKKLILIASALIAVLAIIAAGSGLFWNGLYKNDSKSGAAQEKGNDLITLVLCVPLLAISAYYAAKGSLRGRLVWTAVVFYFLYVYGMMAFESAYNPLFLAYVAAFSLSLYTFAASILTLDVKLVKECFSDAPVTVTAGFMFLVGIMISLMWLSLVIGSFGALAAGERPAVLETYTTLVIQALDLGIIVPLSLITGWLLLKRDAWGYTLASLILIKGVTLGTAVLSMALFQYLNGVEVVIPFVIIFVMLVTISAILTVVYYGRMKVPGTARAPIAV
jgi:hypothetical protein